MMKPKKTGLSHGIAQLLYEMYLEHEPRYHKLLARVLHEVADGIPDEEARYKIPAIRGLLNGSLEWLEPIHGPSAAELEGRLRYLDELLQELRKHVHPLFQQELLKDGES
jgi:hypothetical protein